jgi:hypothetical protein
MSVHFPHTVATLVAGCLCTVVLSFAQISTGDEVEQMSFESTADSSTQAYFSFVSTHAKKDNNIAAYDGHLRHILAIIDELRKKNLATYQRRKNKILRAENSAGDERTAAYYSRRVAKIDSQIMIVEDSIAALKKQSVSVLKKIQALVPEYEKPDVIADEYYTRHTKRAIPDEIPETSFVHHAYTEICSLGERRKADRMSVKLPDTPGDTARAQKSAHALWMLSDKNVRGHLSSEEIQKIYDRLTAEHTLELLCFLPELDCKKFIGKIGAPRVSRFIRSIEIIDTSETATPEKQ